MLDAYHEWAERDIGKNSRKGAKSQRNQEKLRIPVLVCDASRNLCDVFTAFLVLLRETVPICQQSDLCASLSGVLCFRHSSSAGGVYQWLCLHTK